ncbi:sulfotransferase 1C1-like [Oratosquilla oratoria]|uniref:sulfotransferase 1C1-like n=1 Tax=Oratosquilla oratoria TaxID=337810 RepID=UPI003F774BD9
MCAKLKSGHVAVPLEKEEELAQLEVLMRSCSEGVVRLDPGRWLLHTPSLNLVDNIYEHKYRPSDLIIMAYPKCGTTWAQEIVWTMRNNPDLDHPEANDQVIFRSPFLEKTIPSPKPSGRRSRSGKAFRKAFPQREDTKNMFFSLAEGSPDPRSMKTHLSLSLFPEDLLETCKVLYVARNPLDVCISFFHHCRHFIVRDFRGTLDQFVDLFIQDKLIPGPYLQHLKEAWAKKDHKNFHFVFYEDLKEDPLTELKKLDAFLETGLSEDKIRKIRHLEKCRYYGLLTI